MTRIKRKPRRLSVTEKAQELAWTLNDLLTALPPVDYAAAPVALIEAVHAAQDALKEHAGLLAY